METRTRSLLMCGIAALALATAPANRDPVHAATQSTVALSVPRVSVDGARTVVTFEAKGDIRGFLTFILVRDAAQGDKAPVTGQWALVSRYAYDMLTDSELGPTAEDAGYVQAEQFAFAERGTIQGAVIGGSLRFDANGQLDRLDAVRLQIAGGNLEFAGASGSGSASATGLQDVNYGSGTLVLAAEVK